MYSLYRPSEVREAERVAISYGDAAIDMIQRAAAAILDYIYENKDIDCSSVLILAGRGNNGADGILLGRLLEKNGAAVSFYKPKDGPFSKENIYFSNNVSFLPSIPENLDAFTLIVDALYGIGFHGELEETERKLVKHVNASSVPVLSIDVPSGVSALDGTVKTAIIADYTCALNCFKPGHFIYPGKEHCRNTVLLDTDIPPASSSDIAALTAEDLHRLPTRPVRSNKGTFGRVALIAGSCGMAGAAYFAAKAALLTGAGLVEIFTPEENRLILQTLIPEAILTVYDEKTEEEDLISRITACSCMVLGPGLGQGALSQKMVTLLLTRISVPAIVDADGLNLSKNTDLLKNYRGELIITPHPGEASRLMNCSVKEVTEHVLDSAQRLSSDHNCTALLKDAHTVIVSKEKVRINLSGNNGMATAGCGDVLSGIIGALLAEGMSCLDAASYGALIHGLAGDYAAKKHGKRSVTASRVLENIEEALKISD